MEELQSDLQLNSPKGLGLFFEGKPAIDTTQPIKFRSNFEEGAGVSLPEANYIRLLTNPVIRSRALAFLKDCDSTKEEDLVPYWRHRVLDVEDGPSICVFQGEYGVVFTSDAEASGINFIGSDEATTCIILILETDEWACVAHLDGQQQETELNMLLTDIRARLQRRATSPLTSSVIDVRLHLAGGFNDDRACSDETGIMILDFFQRRYLSNPTSSPIQFRFHLTTCCICAHNTRLEPPTNWPSRQNDLVEAPRVRGLALDLRTRHVFPAFFAQRGPETPLRMVLCCYGEETQRFRSILVDPLLLSSSSSSSSSTSFSAPSSPSLRPPASPRQPQNSLRTSNSSVPSSSSSSSPSSITLNRQVVFCIQPDKFHSSLKQPYRLEAHKIRQALLDNEKLLSTCSTSPFCESASFPEQMRNASKFLLQHYVPSRWFAPPASIWPGDPPKPLLFTYSKTAGTWVPWSSSSSSSSDSSLASPSSSSSSLT